MHIIIVNQSGIAKSIQLKTLVFALLFIFAVSFLAVNLITSQPHQSSIEQSTTQQDSQSTHQELLSLLSREKQEVAELKQQMIQQTELYTGQLAQLKTKMLQLDAIGQHLVELEGLSMEDFSFSNNYAQGGPVEPLSEQEKQQQLQLLGPSFHEIFTDLEQKHQDLDVLNALLTNKKLTNDLIPHGKPTKKGWISSYYGVRNDPFSGKLSKHKGIDIAGKLDDEIRVTAAGIVISVTKKSGFGLIVEVQHSNKLITRYAHCHTTKVHVGQIIKRGQVIATMGSSGRSTGPHVHYEILANGRQINPIKYIR